MSKENPTRRDFNKLGLVSILSPSLLVACTSKPKPLPPTQQVPRFGTNTVRTRDSDFGDHRFDSKIRGYHFGESGRHFIGVYKEGDVVTPLDGSDISDKEILPIWTLRVDETGYDIDTEEEKVSIRRPDSAIRAYVERTDMGGLSTNRRFVLDNIPKDQRSFVMQEPEFWLPLLKANNERYAHATYISAGEKKLGLIPNPHKYLLNPKTGALDILGKVYEETLVKVESLNLGINKDSIVTATPIFIDPITEKTKNP